MTCKIIYNSRGLLFSQFVHHHFVPKSSCTLLPSALRRWSGASLAMEKMIPERSAFRSSNFLPSWPIAFLFLNQCYCGIICMQYDAASVSEHFSAFWQIYMPIQPPPQSRQRSFPSLPIPSCVHSFLVNAPPPSLVLGNHLSVFCHFIPKLLFSAVSDKWDRKACTLVSGFFCSTYVYFLRYFYCGKIHMT